MGWVVVWTLTWAAFSKMRDLGETTEVIRGSLKPLRVPVFAGLILVAVELGVGMLLLLELLRDSTSMWGASGATVLFLSFTTVLVINRRRGADIGCGCFGRRTAMTSTMSLFRAGALTATSAFVAFTPMRQGRGSEDVVAALLAVSLIALVATISQATAAGARWPRMASGAQVVEGR